jgi:hypothetical protein
MTKTAEDIVASAKAQMEAVSPHDAAGEVGAANPVLVDVRASLAALTLKDMGYQNVAVLDSGLKA